MSHYGHRAVVPIDPPPLTDLNAPAGQFQQTDIPLFSDRLAEPSLSSSDEGLSVPRYGRCSAIHTSAPPDDVRLLTPPYEVHHPRTQLTRVIQRNKRDDLSVESDDRTKRRKHGTMRAARICTSASKTPRIVLPLPSNDLFGTYKLAKQYMEVVKLPSTAQMFPKKRHTERGLYAAIPECGVHRGKIFSGMFHQQLFSQSCLQNSSIKSDFLY